MHPARACVFSTLAHADLTQNHRAGNTVSPEVPSSPKSCTYLPTSTLRDSFPRFPDRLPSLQPPPLRHTAPLGHPVPVLRLVTRCHGSSVPGCAWLAAPSLWLLLGVKEY